MSDYLFDPKAPPDPAVQELERRLARFRLQDGAQLDLERAEATATRAEIPRLDRGRRVGSAFRWRLFVAAAAAAIVAIWFFLPRAPDAAAPAEPAVRVALDEVEGSVRIDAFARAHADGGALVPGDRVVCEPGGRARLRVGDIGWLTLEENTRVRVAEGHGDEETEGAYRLDLERGTVAALIFAAPRIFSLGTPSGIAVDLGCIYRATVDDDGHTTLAVVSGRVSFESDGRRIYVPAGASCRAWPGFGPGTPTWDDASEELRAAVMRHDEARARKDAAAARRAAEEILTTERERDTLTIFHLLDAPEVELRADVLDRLRELCPPPEELDRARCLAGDHEELVRWRDQLEYECW